MRWRSIRAPIIAQKPSLALLSLAVCFLVVSYLVPGPTARVGARDAEEPAATVPAQFLTLYKELQKTLIEDRRHHYAFNPSGSRPHFAPALFMASSFYHAYDSEDARWHDLLSTVDAFKDMGADTVSVMISAPDLSTDDPMPLVEFYQRLVKELHSRNMKLYIEHFLEPPSAENALRNFPDDTAGRSLFLKMLFKEITLIYTKIKPDYLSIITEPQTLMRWSHLSFVPEELAAWLGSLCTSLKESGASPGTLLGAGSGTWEDETFVVKFAQQENLDYIDLHLYPLKMDEQNCVANLALLVEVVREVRPKMMVTIGECWLYKHGAKETGGVYNRQAYQRDNYSFWTPLDEHFLRLVLAVAQKENIAVVAPYFSQNFFATYTFGDEETNELPEWPQSLIVAWKKALQSLRNHQLSPLGQAMKALLREN